MKMQENTINKIETFISKLSKIEKNNNTTNLYFGESREAQIRKNNLKVYLNKLIKINPKYLLLGEAPGYKGCRLSGIAFTSEKVMFENSFFQNEPIQFINRIDNLESEISATIVWAELSKHNEIPLIWNIFPFHPHKINNINSNRTPSKLELTEGKEILKELIEIFNIQKIIALGRKPESKLSSIGIKSTYVRHPANGGKNDFVRGLNVEMKL